MKKIMMLFALGLVFASCGGPSACDCVQAAKDGDKAAIEECDEYVEGLEGDAKTDFQKAAMECM
jgi:PBP1b-binding outer membrane lipoprotein LpoB